MRIVLALFIIFVTPTKSEHLLGSGYASPDDLVVLGAQGCAITVGLNYKYLDGHYRFGGKLDDWGQVVNVQFNSRNWFYHTTDKGRYYLHWAPSGTFYGAAGATWFISRTNPTLATSYDVVAWYADPPGYADNEYYNVPTDATGQDWFLDCLNIDGSGSATFTQKKISIINFKDYGHTTKISDSAPDDDGDDFFDDDNGVADTATTTTTTATTKPVSRNPANTPAASEDARNVIYAIPLEGSAASSLRSSHGGARRDGVCNLAYEYTPAASDGAPNVVYAIAGGVHKSSNQPQNTISSQHYVDDGFYKLTENNTPSPRTATGEASPVYAIPFEGSNYASAEESRSKVDGMPAVPADDGGGYARPNGDYVATTVHSAESEVFKVGNSSAAAATITAAPAGGDSDVVYAVPLMRPAAKALLDADGYVQDTTFHDQSALQPGAGTSVVSSKGMGDSGVQDHYYSLPQVSSKGMGDSGVQDHYYSLPHNPADRVVSTPAQGHAAASVVAAAVPGGTVLIVDTPPNQTSTI
eukprot:gene6002-30739_t